MLGAFRTLCVAALRVRSQILGPVLGLRKSTTHPTKPYPSHLLLRSALALIFCATLSPNAEAATANANQLVPTNLRATVDGQSKPIMCFASNRRLVPVVTNSSQSESSTDITILSAQSNPVLSTSHRNACAQATLTCKAALRSATKRLTVTAGSTNAATLLPASSRCPLARQFRVISRASKGTSTIRNGRLEYRARAQVSGSDRVVLEVKNGLNQRGRITVQVSILSAAQRCVPAAQSVSASVAENSSVTLSSFITRSCPSGDQPEIITPSQHGSATILGNSIKYSPTPHYIGTDLIRARVKNLNGMSDVVSIAITVNARSADFAGERYSLAPYRSQLSEREIRHILNKVAYGGSPALIALARGPGGLNRLVDRLLDDNPSRWPDPLLRGSSAREGAIRTANQMAKAHNGSGSGCDALYPWTPTGTRAYMMYNAIHGNPLQWKTILFLHDRFALNFDLTYIKENENCAVPWMMREHTAKLEKHALGSFRSLVKGMTEDSAMLGWLDNRLNHYNPNSNAQSFNLNFARELLELFTVNKVNPFNTEQRNYTENDVLELARSVSGFSRADNFRDGPAPSTDNWFQGWGQYSRFFPELHDPGVKQLFPTISGVTGNREAAFSWDSAVDDILDNHPAAPRALAVAFVQHFLGLFPMERTTQNSALSDPLEPLVNQLAAQLKSTNYSMKELLRTILLSSAMFAGESGEGCVRDPIDHVVYAARIGNFPFSRLTTLHSMVNDFSLGGQYATPLRSANHLPGAPADVFSWNVCGSNKEINPRSWGYVWLNSQFLLERHKLVWWLMERHTTATAYGWPLVGQSYFLGESPISTDGSWGPVTERGEGWDPRALFVGGTSLTPDSAIAQLEARFNVTFSAAERTNARNYLTRGSGWNAADADKTKARLAGLFYLFSVHYKTIMQGARL